MFGNDTVTVGTVMLDGELATEFMLPAKATFDNRTMYIGPWSATPYYRTSEANELTPRYVIYKDRGGGDTYTDSGIKVVNFNHQVIDEFRYWNRSLSQEELQDVSSRKLAGDEPGLMIYYNFDEGDPYFTKNQARAFNGKLNGVSLREYPEQLLHSGGETPLAQNDTWKEFALRSISAVTRQSIAENNEYNMPYNLDPPAWTPIYGDNTIVPEAMFPIFDRSFIDNAPRRRRPVLPFFMRSIGNTGRTPPPGSSPSLFV